MVRQSGEPLGVTMSLRLKSKLFGAFSAFVLASGPVLSLPQAQAQSDQAQSDQDPPTSVARIAEMTGTVSFHAPGSQDWQAATLNYPVPPGAGVWAEARSHAAVDIPGARVHLDGASDLEVTNLVPQSATLNVPQGAVILRVYPGVSGQTFEVDTPHGAARIAQPGEYEVVAGDDQHPMTVSVLDGAAQMVGQTANLTLQAGQRGTIAPDNSSTVDRVQQDDFIGMVQGEERSYTAAAQQSAQYVPPQETGYQDLSRYGQWQQSPQYGAIWYPSAVAGDWAPYRYGHWVFVAPWGWTWVDDAPWGFTPFHYGRWIQVGARWGWCPGVRVERPVYAPALVSFFGNIGGVGIDVSLGWVPLGPEEVYVPYYHHSDRYVRDVNIMNVRNETKIVYVTRNTTIINNYNTYVNRRGATMASRDVLVKSQDVGRSFKNGQHPDSDRQWQQAKQVNQIPFQPEANAQHRQGPKLVPASANGNHQKPWQGNANGNGEENGQPKPFTNNGGQPNGNDENVGQKQHNNGGASPYVPQPNANTGVNKSNQPNGQQQNGEPFNASKNKNAAPGPTIPNQGPKFPSQPYQPNGQFKNEGVPNNGKPNNNQAPGPYIPLPQNGSGNGANAASPSLKYGEGSKGPAIDRNNAMPAGKLMNGSNNPSRQGQGDTVPQPTSKSPRPNMIPMPPKVPNDNNKSSAKNYGNQPSSDSQKQYMQELQKQQQQSQKQQQQFQKQQQQQFEQQQQFLKQQQQQQDQHQQENNAGYSRNCNGSQGAACSNK